MDPFFKHVIRQNKQTKVSGTNVSFLKEKEPTQKMCLRFELYCSIKISVPFNCLCVMALVLNPFTAMISLDRMTNKVRNLKPFLLFAFFFTLACERSLIKTHSAESRCVTGPENIPFLRCICASFSQEILHAGAVKGLMEAVHTTV